MSPSGGAEHETLETGWNASTPDRDNLLLAFARTEAAGYGALIGAAGGTVRRDDRLGVHLSDCGSPTPFGNLAHVLRPVADADVPELAATIREFFTQRGGGPFLVFVPWPVADLRPHGFMLAGHPPLMLRAPGGAPVTVDGLRVERVTTSAELTDFEQTLVEGYPAPELQPFGEHPRLFRDAVLDSGWHCYVGYEGDRPIATAAAYVGADVVAVEAVATRSDCRGRGYGAAVTAAATFAAPDRPSMLIASDLGRNVYAQLGYLTVLRYSLYVGLR